MQLYYREFGEGKPLIILHGLFGISDNWVTYGKRIAQEGYKVYILDQRNHGQSPQSHVFNYLALVDDLFEFIDEHDLKDVTLIGHSMGGKVAMHFTLENPQYISRLIVVDISLRAYAARPHHKNIIKAMQEVNFAKISSRKEVEDILSHTIKEQRIRMFVMKNLHRINRNKFEWRLYIEGIGDNLDQMFDAIEINEAYHKPTLFIRGGLSNYILESDRTYINQAFPNHQLYTIPETTHWVQAEAPEVFFQLTKEFLR